MTTMWFKVNIFLGGLIHVDLKYYSGNQKNNWYVRFQIEIGI